MEKKMLEAQAQLMHKAALLMLVRQDGEMVSTDCYPSIESFSFNYGTIKIRFDRANPFSQEQVDAVLLALDDMLTEERKHAEKVVYTINQWRGL
jgi:hypothetical protein